ncbi:MAG: class I SAM-dependent methyltransferase [Xenococcaceae cyanobacterium]
MKLKTIKYIIQHPYELPIILREKIYGIDTQKTVPVKETNLNPQRALGYTPSGNKYLSQVLDNLNITERDSIVDLGSGKGSALIWFARYPFGKIAGVELSSEFLETARTNFQKLGIKNIDLFCLDAGNFDKLDDYNYIYMSNPFPEIVVDEVIQNLKKSLIKKPRLFTIIYKIPVGDRVILKSNLFEKVAEFNTEFKHNEFNLNVEDKFFVYQNKITKQ